MILLLECWQSSARDLCTQASAGYRVFGPAQTRGLPASLLDMKEPDRGLEHVLRDIVTVRVGQQLAATPCKSSTGRKDRPTSQGSGSLVGL